eukprot:sb/3474787/
MVHAIQKRRQSAPSAAFFANTLPSGPNLEKVLEENADQDDDQDLIYEARSMSPPLVSTPPVRRKTLAATQFSPIRGGGELQGASSPVQVGFKPISSTRFASANGNPYESVTHFHTERTCWQKYISGKLRPDVG